jgi:branched-subunit amino acid transport protein AzlD
MMHVDSLYINITSIAHSYHHENPNLFGNILNAIIEYLGLMGNIVIKYITAQFGVNFFFINEWLIVFLYLIYTTVHNINYGYLKVNNYHTKHHHDYRTNIGPDIFDYLFNTKNKETLEMECIDHYIPNIICSFIIVCCLKNVHENINKEILPQIFTYAFVILLIISIIGCAYVFNDQLDTIMYKELNKFTNNTKTNEP